MSEPLEAKEHLDHVVHQAINGHGGRFNTTVALIAAVLALLAALTALISEHWNSLAMLAKTDASVLQGRASDQWAYYQAKATRGFASEAFLEYAEASGIDATRLGRIQAKAARYEQEKQELKTAAEELERQRAAADERSEHAFHRHHRFAIALALLQVGIVLATVSLVAASRWLLMVAVLIGGAGAAYSAFTLLSGESTHHKESASAPAQSG